MKPIRRCTRRHFSGALGPFIGAAALAACGSPVAVDAGGDVLRMNDVAMHSDGAVGIDVAPGTDVPAGMDVRPATDVPVGIDAPTTMDVPVTSDVPTVVDAGTDVTTSPSGVAIVNYGVDIGRTGANRNETALTVAALMANRLGKDTAFHAATLDGDVYTQPLYLPSITIAGAAHDVLFVPTQADTMWALDALTGAALWHTNVGTPVLRTQQPCGNISPQTGILGGPVIDQASGTIYFVAYTRTGGANVFTINALDVATGMQHSGYPAPITPPVSNGSTFTASPQGERGAITLVGGRLYVPFGGLWGDCGSFHGWVVGIDSTMPTHQTSFATPGTESGIWAPAGISSDGTTLFASTGNGRAATDMGEYIMRFDTGAAGPTLMTGTTNYFTPSNRLSLDTADIDIGSNAPVVLPDQTGTSTPHLLFQGGKSGVGYLVNRDNLGGQGTGDGVRNEGVYSAQVSSGGVYGATASWSDGTNVFVFVPVHGNRGAPCTGSGGVVTLRLGTAASGASSFATAWCSAATGEGAPAVSSNGNSDGILWVAYAGGGTVNAYRISDGMQIWTTSDATAIRKWVPPVVANGRVYVTGSNTVTMYRLIR